MILVVEDDYDISELICHHLERDGYEDSRRLRRGRGAEESPLGAR